MSNALAVNDSTFAQEVIQSPTPVVVDFWAEWCGPCQRLGPVLDELAGDFNGRAKVVKVNVDENPELAGEYGVTSIPLLLFFKKGQVVDQVLGLQSKGALSQKLSALL
ncbi:MAG: thioredoxin [Planctomycetota bacterium]